MSLGVNPAGITTPGSAVVPAITADEEAPNRFFRLTHWPIALGIQVRMI
jgi:hypothetical protein